MFEILKQTDKQTNKNKCWLNLDKMNIFFSSFQNERDGKMVSEDELYVFVLMMMMMMITHRASGFFASPFDWLGNSGLSLGGRLFRRGDALCWQWCGMMVRFFVTRSFWLAFGSIWWWRLEGFRQHLRYDHDSKLILFGFFFFGVRNWILNLVLFG